MIPRTYPSRVNSTTGRVEALVSFISSTTGLQRWVDYTPVAFVTDATPVEGSYDNDGYIAVADVGSTTGLQAGKDYIRVYLDPNATDAWRVNSVGFIPVGYSGIGGIPYALFANNEQGVWYDPSDRTTLFQDSAGTTPVTAVEQPVGLMLDKSKGLVLGPELVTNGTFDTDVSGWTVDQGTITWGATGSAVVSSASAYSNAANQSVPTTIGKTYRVTFTKTNGTSTDGRVTLIGFNPTNTYVSNFSGTSFIFVAVSTSLRISLQTNGAGTVLFDNISVRELPGNHAFQTTSTSRPVLSARYNLLTKTEQFDDGAWSKYNSSVSANSTLAPDGTLSADTFSQSSAVGAIFVSAGAAGAYTFSVFAKENTNRYFSLIVGQNSTTEGLVVFDLRDGVVGQTRSGTLTTNVSGSISSVGGGWYRCAITYSITGATNHKFELAPALTGNTLDANGEITGNTPGNSVFIWGADLRAANDAAGQPAYQRVNTATDYDTTGFKPYLRFDGTDDWLQTNSINFTGTDKMTVFAGGRTLSNTNYGGIVGLSANINDAGAFLIWLRSSAGGGQTDAYARGSTSATTGSQTSNSAITVPSAFVYTTQYDIAQADIADEIKLRWNGAALAATGTSTAGTGNFANAALTIGQYNSSNRFNGRLYGLIVRGAATTTATIQATETYMNGKTGAY